MEERDRLSGGCASRAPGLPHALKRVRLEEMGKGVAAFAPFPSFPCTGVRCYIRGIGVMELPRPTVLSRERDCGNRAVFLILPLSGHIYVHFKYWVVMPGLSCLTASAGDPKAVTKSRKTVSSSVK